MTKKSQLFAFVVGEVSPQFYGRRDLAKFPLAVKTAENFFIDYRGGAVFCPGTEFIGGLLPEAHKLVRFRTRTADLALFFTENTMRVLRDGAFVLDGDTLDMDLTGGVATGNYPLADGQLVHIQLAEGSAYGYVRDRTDTGLRLDTAYAVPLDTPARVTPVYELPVTLGPAVTSAKFFQDRRSLVVTDQSFSPKLITWVADDSWTVANLTAGVPPVPTNVSATATGAGAASVAFAVTAVVDDVESGASTQFILSDIVNYSNVEGSATVTWDAVPGASRYNVYRSVVYPAAYPAGAQLGYIGYTTGTSFVDLNITGDFTKSPPAYVDFFAGGNYPALYCRFQQRGAFAGLAEKPLSVVSSIARRKELFAISAPPNASDSYEYELDAGSDRPIKHMIPLRYGLMLFTEDGVWQLKGGGESYALTATNAVAEDQGYVSVGDAAPIAINLDLLFLTALNTELNAMLYTEYTNSFKMQDILVLAAHLFGPSNKATRMEWAPEPHKLVHLVREDGQRVALTYERNQEVFGWSRRRTRGKFLDLCVISENKFNVCYNSVERVVGGKAVLCLERDMPLAPSDYASMWYVDAGRESVVQRQNFSLTVRRVSPSDELGEWHMTADNITWAEVGQRIFVPGGLYQVHEVTSTHIVCRAMKQVQITSLYDRDSVTIPAGKWSYGTPGYTLGGLWHLEGETVSVLADGDAVLDLEVVDGQVTLIDAAVRILVGLPYHGRLETLPLGLEGYTIEGSSMTIRGVAFRQQETRGLAIGRSFDDMSVLESRTEEAWGNPLSMLSELTLTDLFGWGGWEQDVSICFEQKYPLPANILGVTADLDVGE